jgi:hypothetical protein
MANLSDVLVEIDIPIQVKDEMLAYINANQEGDYGIIDAGFDEKIGEDGHLYLAGNTCGRWTYDTNLDGYFGENVKTWLGVGYDYGHYPDDRAKKLKAAANKAYRAYTKLCSALKRNNVAIEIHYRESEGGNCFISEGYADFDGKTLNRSAETFDYDITSYIQVFGGSILDAISYLYGEDILDTFYAEKGKDAPLTQFEQWYANYEGE